MSLFAANGLYSFERAAYNVEIETSNNGTMTVAVPQLKAGQYQINSIYVKTKKKIEVHNNSFTSDVLRTSFQGINLQIVRKLSSANGQKLVGTPADRMYLVQYEIGIDSYDMAQELMKNPDIEYAVPVFNRYFLDYTPNDPAVTNQWFLTNQQSGKVWDVTKGSEEIVIGIVDSGTDWQHEDLNANIFINENEIPNNGIDDDNNGFIDDVNGWDFVGNINVNQAVNQQFQPDNNPRPNTGSQNSHGTHVAGCASGVTNNGVGIASLGFKTKMIPIKCGSDNWDGNIGGTRGIFRGYEGMLYAAENGAHIINCSWGGAGSNPAEQEIINSITEMGVLIVASSGNNGSNNDEELFFPTGYNNILSVGAYANNNRVSGFSNFGITTDLFSPGSGILATFPGNTYGNSDGTSMAGPIAAGLAALVKAQNPTWTPHQIMAQLRSTTDALTGVTANDKPLYFGKINSLKAVTANANNFASNKTKGMAFSETDFTSSGTITNYEFKDINLKLVNYLAPVDGVKLEFLAMDKFFEIETSQTILNGLKTMDTSDVAIRIKLNELNPWYDGYARVLIKYTSEGYSDYQLLKVPIEIKSNNRLTLLGRIPEEYYFRVNDVHTPNLGVYWAVGQSIYFNFGLVFNNQSNSPFQSYNEPLTGIYATNGSQAMATTSAGNLLNTLDAGRTWSARSFADVTPSFKGISFFDVNIGVAYGDPMSGQFGVIKTTTGGEKWTKVSTVSSQTNEKLVTGSNGYFEDKIWLGTSTGRVLRGRNYGSNWTAAIIEAGSNVIDVAFHSANEGIAIYSNKTKYGSAVIMSKSNDGGINWSKNTLNFEEKLGVKPIELLYNETSERIYVVCEKGEILTTKNLGATWETVLSKQGYKYEKVDLSNNVENFTLYGADGSSMTSLSFTSVPANAKAVLTSVAGTEFIYDSTEINKLKNKSFPLKNDGDLIVLIDSIYFTGADKEAFSYFGNPTSEINRGEQANLLVTFRPKVAKNYTAQMIIVSNNNQGNITINLSGKGFELKSTSVEFEKFDKSISLYPIPAQNSINLISNYNDKIQMIRIMDLSGKEIREIDEVSNNMTFDLSGIQSGVYLVQFVTINGTFYKKFIKE